MGRDRFLGIVLAVFGVAAGIAATQLAAQSPEWVLFVSLTIAGLCFVAGLAIAMWPTGISKDDFSARMTMTTERKSIFDQSTNVGDNNSGTVAPVYNNVVNQAPPPEIEWISDDNRQIGNRYSFKSLFRVVAPYPAATLKLEVHGRGIRDLQVIPQSAGMHQFGHSGQRDTFSFTTIQNAFGSYVVQFTSDDTNPELKYDF